MAVKKEDVLQAFAFRHACKVFDPQRIIPAEDFNFILETARLSPSSFGMEPWRFVVIQNRQIREKLLPVSWGASKQLPTSSHFVVVLARKTGALKWDAPYMEHMIKRVHRKPDEIYERLRGLIRTFQESHFKLLESERAMFDWACRQAYIALGNMMTSAAHIGIDSSPIEGFDKDGVEQVLVEEGVMDRETFGVAVMVAFGYRVNDQGPKTRQEMGEIVQWVE